MQCLELNPPALVARGYDSATPEPSAARCAFARAARIGEGANPGRGSPEEQPAATAAEAAEIFVVWVAGPGRGAAGRVIMALGGLQLTGYIVTERMIGV